MRQHFIIPVILFLSLRCFSQEPGSMMYSDSLTYNLYLQKNWEELITRANKAIEEGNDYYYMRMRLGIAYYERQNYARASIHFCKALEFNTGDQVALEYLYYSYYLSGKYFLAWTVVNELNPANRTRIMKESRFKRNSVTAETFYLNADAKEIADSRGMLFKNPEAGSQAVTQTFINNSIYLSHITGKRSSYFHSFTNLVKHSIFHYYDGSISSDMISHKVVQNQYYGRLNLFTSTGWTFSPSFHFLSAGYTLPAYSYSGTIPSVYKYDARTNGFAAGFGITRTSGYHSWSGEAVYSKLNKTGQAQGTLTLVYYPGGNQNLYIGGNFTTLYLISKVSGDMNIITGFTAGFSIKRSVWFEFSGTSGNMKNFSENNGLIIYNGLDYPTGKYIGRVTIPFNKTGITVFAGAGFGKYTSEFVPLDGYNNDNPNKLTYSNYKVTGGLSWNF